MVKAALLSVAALLATGIGAPDAEGRPGHRHHHHRHYHYVPRVVFFTPFYTVPRYYYPAPAPVTYIEQPPVPQPGVAPQLYSGSYWYCPSAGAYYPAVPQCPEAWTQVPPPPGR